MSTTVTGTYNSIDKVRNAEDDLRAIGIPNEQFFVDEIAMQVKVLIPEATKPEILELLNRHSPTQLVY